MVDLRLVVGGALIALFALSTPAVGWPGEQAEGSQVVVDIAGDANGVNAVGVEQDTRPASYGPADLLHGAVETTYVAIPVGDDGIHYEPTGLRVRLGTLEPPNLPEYPPGVAGPSIFRLVSNIDGLTVRLDASVHRETDGSLDAIAYIHVTDGCFGGGGPCWRQSRASWKASIDPAQKAVILFFPFEELNGEGLALLGPGNAITAPRGETVLSYSRTTIQAGGQFLILERGALADGTPPGQDFVVGSDVPPDVPCTRACPID